MSAHRRWWRASTHIKHVLDERLVCGHFGPLDDAHFLADPRQKDELLALGHLVAHLDANVAEGALRVAELLAELLEALAPGMDHDLGAVELEHRPLGVCEIGAHVLVGLANGVLVQ